MSHLKKCTVGPYKNCVEIKSGELRLAITTDVGPRIIGCFIGEKSKFNHFAVLPPTPFEASDNGFALYGGHRIWHSPEALPRTYEPDNVKVDYFHHDDMHIFTTKCFKETGIVKQLAIRVLPGSMVEVSNTIFNAGNWEIELAPWTLALMAPGGKCIMPYAGAPDDSPYAPNATLNLWPYTNIKDKRLAIGKEYIIVSHDPKVEAPLKIGCSNTRGWVAYVNNNQALIKQFCYDFDGKYPDMGCSSECYANNLFTEMEALGPLERLKPGQATTLVEYWQPLDNLPEIKTEKDVTNHILGDMIDIDMDDDEYGEDECCCGHHHHACDDDEEDDGFPWESFEDEDEEDEEFPFANLTDEDMHPFAGAKEEEVIDVTPEKPAKKKAKAAKKNDKKKSKKSGK